MNINLSSVSESPKVTKATTEGGEASAETSETGGFFSKLAALIKGESGSEEGAAKVKQTSADGEEVALTKGEATEKSVKAEVTEGQTVDELLASEEGDSDAKAVSATSDEGAKVEKSVAESGEEKSPQSAAKIVSENDQVLQRLDSANKALQPNDGKQLPPEEVTAVQNTSQQAVDIEAEQNATADKAVTTAALSKQAQEVAVEGEETQLAAEKTEPAQAKQVVVNADGEEVLVPESAQRFIKQESEQTATEQQTKDVNNDTVITSSVAAKVASEQQSQTAAQNSEKMALEGEQVAKQISVDQPVKQSDSSAESIDLAAGAVVAGGVAAATLADKPVQSEATVTQGTSPANQAASLASEAQSEVAADSAITAAAVTAGAIPWATSNETVIADEVVIKPDTAPKAQQAAVAQSVHQALTAQQAQAQLSQGAAQVAQNQSALSAMPNELVASQMQQVAAAPNSALLQDQAVLKAAMGAKAVGTLGKLGSGKEGSQQASESSSGFAQQLAQASGQPGTNGLGQIRAEQAAAQSPLQLTRELAGDQVAERVQMMMSKNLKNIDIRLDPPELGRLQIRMNMNGDAATVHFTVANQQARDVIEQSMPRLREMLAQQGVQLGDSSVQQQASGQQQRRYADNGQGNSGQGGSNQGFSGEENLEPDINLDLNVAAKRDGISYYA
ncbi:flagellar hook-length control protein FliK [Vibrio brasiliensis]|uniref:Flagellar hook-length control protein FliK n=1 Tax=Vibrio brasiliensis LMG 20546 TaxID=945543 RepID=E8LPJ2_9VIBR|nr:flagellar hook-length control protein FliK [Vibrio brasiliensis]EGA67399.1 flagellar hook-length control protein FliK [Vibrio brasiliensis LMG 20546]